MANSALTGIVAAAASQSEMEAASATNVYTSPGRQQYHPAACKCWITFTGDTTTSIIASYNITSVTDGGTGTTTVTIATDFSSANYAITGCAERTSATFSPSIMQFYSAAAGSFGVFTCNSGFTLSDFYRVSLAAFGDQA